MAFSCDYGWLHMNNDWVFLEPVDEQLRPTPPGGFSNAVLLAPFGKFRQVISLPWEGHR